MEYIKFAQVNKDKDFTVPTKRATDAGYDLYCSFMQDNLIIEPLTTRLIPTNLACLIPDGYYFQIEERGSTGSKGIKKSAGVIDSSYRAEIFIAITNCNNKPILITKETETEALTDDYIIYPYTKAIAQMVLHKVDEFPTELVDYQEILNTPSERGTGALGSSGK